MIILKLLETQALHLYNNGIKCNKHLTEEKGCKMCKDFQKMLEESLSKAKLI